MTLSADQAMAKHAFNDYRKANYPALSEDKAFEYYATHLVTKQLGVSAEVVRQSIVGEGGDGGLDSVMILLNKTEFVGSGSVRLTNRKASLDGLQKGVPLDIVVVQSKNVDKWDSEVFPKIRDALQLMMDASVSVQKLREFPLNEDVIEAAQTLRKLQRKLVPLTPDVTFEVSYVCFAKKKDIDQYRVTKRGLLEKFLKDKLPTRTKVKVEYVGAERINDLDAQSSDFDVTLEFAKAPVRDGHALVGLVRVRDYAKFLRRPRSEAIREEMFAVNVRDFAGKTARVNAAIGETLAADDKSAFWWLNNGITIIADETSDPSETKWVLTNPLIVNGLQTSNVVHAFAVEKKITKKRLSQSLLVRVIKAPEPEIREAVITGTNNQTTVNSLQLHANDDLQIRLERYLRSKGWYYERRRYQYRNTQPKPPASKVRSVTELAQAMMAVHLLVPDTARARPATQLSTKAGFGRVFDQQLPELLYEKSLTVLEAVESYLQSGTGKSHADTATNARFYLASGHVIRSVGLKSLSTFSAAVSVKQIKARPTIVELDMLHSMLDAAVASLDDGKTARDQIFKGSELKKVFFDAILKLNGQP
ncbi:AIPR family protein [Frigoribacterium faeni]|uniref:AIPR family protein n=1 Tax=Frigoribacterium faeni TaxID=145483 RepID=UPI00141A9642|nr:AIPR family protein [Frigoribacterium faeni]NIJ04249.1 hypothetical protein [Frigoribacterium faeni]